MRFYPRAEKLTLGRSVPGTKIFIDRYSRTRYGRVSYLSCCTPKGVQTGLRRGLGDEEGLELDARVIAAAGAIRESPGTGAVPNQATLAGEEEPAACGWTAVAVGDLPGSALHPVVFGKDARHFRSQSNLFFGVRGPRRHVDGTRVTGQPAVRNDLSHDPSPPFEAARSPTLDYTASRPIGRPIFLCRGSAPEQRDKTVSPTSLPYASQGVPSLATDDWMGRLRVGDSRRKSVPAARARLCSLRDPETIQTGRSRTARCRRRPEHLPVGLEQAPHRGCPRSG